MARCKSWLSTLAVACWVLVLAPVTFPKAPVKALASACNEARAAAEGDCDVLLVALVPLVEPVVADCPRLARSFTRVLASVCRVEDAVVVAVPVVEAVVLLSEPVPLPSELVAVPADDDMLAIRSLSRLPISDATLLPPEEEPDALEAPVGS